MGGGGGLVHTSGEGSVVCAGRIHCLCLRFDGLNVRGCRSNHGCREECSGCPTVVGVEVDLQHRHLHCTNLEDLQVCREEPLDREW